MRSGDDLLKDSKESQLWHSKAGPDGAGGAPKLVLFRFQHGKSTQHSGF